MTNNDLEEIKNKIIALKQAAKMAEDLKKKLDESQERMETIANLFSDSVWKILPQKIKVYFEEYRD